MSPIDMQNLWERARGAFRLGDYREAERLLLLYLQQNPSSREARLLLGITRAKEEKFADAETIFRDLLAENPKDLEALNNLAVIYRRQERFTEALDMLERALELDPGRVELHYNMANIYKQTHNYKAAAMAYARVIELDNRYIPAYNNLGTMYEKLHEWDRACEVYKKGLSLDRNNPTLHFNYGIALEAQGQLEGAAAEYEAALRARPGWIEAMNNLALVRYKQGHHREALEGFRRILAIDPDNAEAHNNRGLIFADEGNFEEAIREYRQALELDPHSVKAVVNLEYALESVGRLGDALVELERLVKLVPDSIEVRLRLASLYLKLQRYPEALEQAERALEWDERNVQALRIKGIALRALGKTGEAQKIFEKILQIDPTNYSFYLDLADLHFQNHQYPEAEQRLLSYLQKRPQDRDAKFLLARLYGEMGHYSHAIQILEELVRQNPHDAEALASLAQIQEKAGNVERALRTVDALINLQGKRATPEDISDLNASLEMYEKIIRQYAGSLTDVWKKNVSRLVEQVPEEEPELDTLLLGTTEKVSIEEDADTLFIEDVETIEEPEPEEEEILPEDALTFPEEESPPHDSWAGLVEGPSREDEGEKEGPFPSSGGGEGSPLPSEGETPGDAGAEALSEDLPPRPPQKERVPTENPPGEFPGQPNSLQYPGNMVPPVSFPPIIPASAPQVSMGPVVVPPLGSVPPVQPFSAAAPSSPLPAPSYQPAPATPPPGSYPSAPPPMAASPYIPPADSRPRPLEYPPTFPVSPPSEPPSLSSQGRPEKGPKVHPPEQEPLPMSDEEEPILPPLPEIEEEEGDLSLDDIPLEEIEPLEEELDGENWLSPEDEGTETPQALEEPLEEEPLSAAELSDSVLEEPEANLPLETVSLEPEDQTAETPDLFPEETGDTTDQLEPLPEAEENLPESENFPDELENAPEYTEPLPDDLFPELEDSDLWDEALLFEDEGGLQDVQEPLPPLEEEPLDLEAGMEELPSLEDLLAEERELDRLEKEEEEAEGSPMLSGIPMEEGSPSSRAPEGDSALSPLSQRPSFSPQEEPQSPLGPASRVPSPEESVGSPSVEGGPVTPSSPTGISPEAERPYEGKSPAPPPLELFRYLKELTEQLPEEQKRAFQRSEARLKMEYVMEKLEGQGGLLRKAEERIIKEKTEEVPRASRGAAQGLPPVSETLRYLRSMAGNLPDPDLSQVMGKKLEKVLKNLNGKGGTRDT